jgi:hypothetical protein
MKPHRANAFVDAAPIGGRGHRTRRTELLISERDKLLVERSRAGCAMAGRPARCCRTMKSRW